jgi:hypothetical protein
VLTGLTGYGGSGLRVITANTPPPQERKERNTEEKKDVASTDLGKRKR